ncbi:MAG: type II toxin-antitoxin system RelE/ParE family toxin [Deltaproteobacteria bacterium]|nr:type II toxin-antitoxin system RelE/ParE family toxin [Deltaproteobacteria bacterium]
MSVAVLLTQEAEDDLVALHAYVSATASVARADALLTRLEDACRSLETMPRRGHVPPELERVGVTDFREIHVRPYRIIYEIVDGDVHVHAVLDGRRDLPELLAQRLLR